jgi:hypothetical protein
MSQNRVSARRLDVTGEAGTQQVMNERGVISYLASTVYPLVRANQSLFSTRSVKIHPCEGMGKAEARNVAVPRDARRGKDVESEDRTDA